MLANFFSLALQGILRKKRSSILIFLVLLFSFSCAIVTLSLTGSIRDTNTEYRLNTFGEWYVAVTNSTAEDGAWLKAQGWARTVAHTQVYGQVVNPYVGFGTVDQAYLDMGRAKLIDGRLPEALDEIAVEERILHKLGIETYQPGQKITLSVNFPVESAASGEGNPDVLVVIDCTFTLCGVFQDFNTVWRTDNPAISAMVTEETAQAFRCDAENYAQKKFSSYELRVLEPADQYFVRVNQGDQLKTPLELGKHTFYSQSGKPQQVNINYSAYPSGQKVVPSEDLYIYLVAAVALIAVLCVYIMQLSAQVHSFAILRSIGITKGQLLLLALMESLLLAVPAVALGVPLGAFLTWAGLQLVMYSGSVAVQVAVPYDMLGKLFLLWVGVILLSRLIIFFVTIRTPLTGRMQMLAEKVRQTKRLRTALIALILVVFGTVVTYTASEASSPIFWLDQIGQAPHYEIGVGLEPIPLETAQMISQIPGISHVEGFLRSTNYSNRVSPHLVLSYEGLEEQDAPYVDYFMVEADYWEQTFDFGADKEAFQNGEIVLLCFSEDHNNLYEELYGPMKEVLPSPGEKILLQAYDERNLVVAEDWVDVRVRHIPEGSFGRYTIVVYPYTIVFSPAYLEKFLSGLEPGARWECYTGGEAFGYQRLLVTADLNAADLSSDLALDTFCYRNSPRLYIDSDREERQTERQAYLQELIMLFACGGCVAVVTLLLFGSALALEAEEERRSFGLLRTIGMSGKQVRRRVSGKALARSVFAVAAGWGLTRELGLWTALQRGGTLPEAIKRYFYRLSHYDLNLESILLISLACALVLMTISIGIKRSLWKARQGSTLY